MSLMNDSNDTGYWVDGPYGCPIGGPFDVWRRQHFLEEGSLPDDTTKMYPALSTETVHGIAVAAVHDNQNVDEVRERFANSGPVDQISMAHRYFAEWGKKAPFTPDSWQDIPQRPARTTPEPLEEFLEDWRNVNDIGYGSKIPPHEA